LGMDATKKEEKKVAKYVHVTLHKITNKDKDYWVKKGMSFRANPVACLVGLEENHEEGKGVHAHIVLQFSTRQLLSRKQFVDHFGTDSLHISTKPDKQALLMALGYVSKTGNTAQKGMFTHRGVELDSNPEVYRFQYEVKTKLDGIEFFHKVIKEGLRAGRNNIIREYSKRADRIGRWLMIHRSVATSLHKQAQIWYAEDVNSRKEGFEFMPFVHSVKSLKAAYLAYLQEFSAVFEAHLPRNSSLVLERDFKDHATHDLGALQLIVDQLSEALEYGPKRPHKSLNLHLWSRAPSFGKTRLLHFLEDHLVAYRLPDDQWYVDYKNGVYQILLGDEAPLFVEGKSYGHLKHILEGEPVEFNLKRRRKKIMKEDNPLIVLAENISFDELMTRCFKKQHQPHGIRILDLEIRGRATLHFLLDRCILKKNEPARAQEVL